MAEPVVWGDGVTGTGIGLDVWNARTVVATDWSGGRLLAFAVEDGHLDVWGDGYLNPEGISIAGDEALIVEQGGTLLRQPLATPAVRTPSRSRPAWARSTPSSDPTTGQPPC